MPETRSELPDSTRSAGTDLRSIFDAMQTVLHRYGHTNTTSYVIVFQLVVVKLFLEDHPLGERYLAPALERIAFNRRWKAFARESFAQVYAAARLTYRAGLPESLPADVACAGDVLCELWQLVHDASLLTASLDSMQDFFMYFGSVISREDLAQHFTPFPVMRFIVDLVNPQPGERIVEPCCGTADFLAAAIHHTPELGDVKGYDISPEAVALARFNMMLHAIRARYAARPARDPARDAEVDAAVTSAALAAHLTGSADHVRNRSSPDQPRSPGKLGKCFWERPALDPGETGLFTGPGGPALQGEPITDIAD